MARVVQRIATFHLVCLAWVFFRAATLSDAWYIVSHLPRGWHDVIAAAAIPTRPDPLSLAPSASLAIASLAVIVMLACEAVEPNGGVRGLVANRAWWIRWPTYYALVATILVFGVFERSSFIYFQF